MWRPGFEPDAFEPARLDGWHRALCITSTHYRGTPCRPGLVLGLAPGRSCTGRALAVAAERAQEVIAYLDARELLDSYVYDRRLLPLTILRTGAEVSAWCYVARPDHPDYAGGLDPAVVAERVRVAHGLTGSNADYVRNTVAHLTEMGIRELDLELVVGRLPTDA